MIDLLFNSRNTKNVPLTVILVEEKMSLSTTNPAFPRPLLHVFPHLPLIVSIKESAYNISKWGGTPTLLHGPFDAVL
jgi:hypothetical protein